MFYAPSTITFLVAAPDASPDSRVPANLILTGINDAQRINQLLYKLPAVGGHVHLTEGTYTLSEALTWEGDNLLLSGRGRATHLVRDGVNPCISAGTRTGWVVRDLRTDAGGVDLSTAVESAATYWRDGGSYEVVGYPGLGSDVVLSDTGQRVKRIYVEGGKLKVVYDDGA